MTMKKRTIHFVTIALLLAQVAASQRTSLNLEQCYALARQNYPLLKQQDLLYKTTAYTLDNLGKGYLPQLNLGGQATLQSEVTKLPISLPGIQVPELSKDQYKLYAELNQPLTDAAVISGQKEVARAAGQTEAQKLEVELFKLRERVQQLYFGVLLAEAQQKQSELVKADLETAIRRVEAAVANGIAIPSGKDQLLAERLKVEQRLVDLDYAKKSYLDMLGVFIHQDLSGGADLILPEPVTPSTMVNRPELKMFDSQTAAIAAQHNLLNRKNLPRFSLFVQAGYGRPALNMLSNEFKPYYIGGLRFAWNIGGLYTYGRDKKLLDLNRQSIDVQKELFVFATNLQVKQQNNEIMRLENLLRSDGELLRLREGLRLTASRQLENGTLTALDYLGQVNAEDQARMNYSLHSIQLRLAQYNLEFTTGN